MASHPIYEFNAELEDFEPKIWRRFQVTDDITVARLAYIVMTLFEMKASHLFAVEVPYAENIHKTWRQQFPRMTEETYHEAFAGENRILRYEIMDDDFEPLNDPNIKESNAIQTHLSHVIGYAGEHLRIEYDFGDDWWVDLTLLKVFEDKELDGKLLPRVLNGAGFGIVEDCGGVGGLEELVGAFKKKKGERYREFREWLGVDDFDITAFDIDDMNFRLKKIPRIYKQCYEDRLSPTRQSINLIERKYLKK